MLVSIVQEFWISVAMHDNFAYLVLLQDISDFSPIHIHERLNERKEIGPSSEANI